jgi:predicted nuclease of predicted toxin-antitoxin system
MLLLDENIAARLISSLAELYPGCAHVDDCGLAGASDLAIWQYARDHNLVIVSKDEDFQRLSVLHGAPPKVIWLRLGNCSTADIGNLLIGRRGEIERFVADREAAFLALA